MAGTLGRRRGGNGHWDGNDQTQPESPVALNNDDCFTIITFLHSTFNDYKVFIYILNGTFGFCLSGHSLVLAVDGRIISTSVPFNMYHERTVFVSNGPMEILWLFFGKTTECLVAWKLLGDFLQPSFPFLVGYIRNFGRMIYHHENNDPVCCRNQ